MNWKLLGKIASLLVFVLLLPVTMFWVAFAAGAAGTAFRAILDWEAPVRAVGDGLLAIGLIVVILSVSYGMLKMAMSIAKELSGLRRRSRKKHRPF